MTAALAGTPIVPPRSRRAVLAALGSELAPSLAAAAVAGFLFAGVGGRLAMFVLRLTSSSTVIGLESDDGFIIGRFTLATLGFVFFLTAAPMIVVGVPYTLARLWFPSRSRPLVFATFFGVFGGAGLVHSDGIDFVVLSPRSLAIALFISIPAAFGAALEPLHALARRQVHRLPELVLLAVPVLVSVPLALIGPPGIVLTVSIWGVVLFRQGERVATALRTQPIAWAGRVAMLAAAGFAFVDLARDISALL
jgi:hypothetical protein